jgi:broad specificity phosphatase PhoE
VTQLFRALSAAAAICLALAVLAAGSAAAGGASPDSQAGATATVYLARHGETEGEGPERWLSAAGRSRAEALAERLADAGIERIYTTDLPRTRETAAPIAVRLGLEPELYDPDDLAGFAAELRRARGVLLVVGHSNTNPELVGLLGGEPGEPIAEDEHDRLYRLELPGGATEVSRFGPG